MSGLPANVRPGSAQADETTPQGVLRVFQHPLNFCFCDEALKLQQLIIFTGVIDMAEAFASIAAQVIILDKLTQGIALANRKG